MLNGGLLRIRESLHNIKRSEQNAAHYILANPDEVIRLSIKELAERSESSQAAIIRMCKSIGVDGFQELKIRIAGDLQSSTAQDEYKEILPDADMYTLIESVSLNNILSLRETSQIITTMKQARKSGAVTIGITKYGTNSF